MPIYVSPADPSIEDFDPTENSQSGLDTAVVNPLTAGIKQSDGCPILTRIKAFIVDQGVVPTLEHVMRAKNGRPLDFRNYLQSGSPSGSESGSDSDSISQADPACSVVLRIREWLGDGLGTNIGLVEVSGEIVDAANGVVRAKLTPNAVDTCGIYELSWGLKDNADVLVAADKGIMSVERSLFAFDVTKLSKNTPPTLNELRMWMMDSSPAENLLLDDVEFADEQLLLALTMPIRKWNESPPDLRCNFTTKTFPYRGAWTSAALGELYTIAAAGYRRNRLGSAAAGINVDDKNKEQEYMREGQRLRDEYTAWMLNKKMSINMKLFEGASLSPYSHHVGGW